MLLYNFLYLQNSTNNAAVPLLPAPPVKPLLSAADFTTLLNFLAGVNGIYTPAVGLEGILALLNFINTHPNVSVNVIVTLPDGSIYNILNGFTQVNLAIPANGTNPAGYFPIGLDLGTLNEAIVIAQQEGLLPTLDSVSPMLSESTPDSLSKPTSSTEPVVIALTGIVTNKTRGFTEGNNGGGQGETKVSSLFIVCHSLGFIYGYNPMTYIKISGEPIIMPSVDNLPSKSSYRGVALYGNSLYAADFYNRRIDVYDFNFSLLTGYPFIDQDEKNPLPSDYSPFNIYTIGEFLYVLYAKQMIINQGTFTQLFPVDVPGSGNGYISVFKSDGTFVKRLVSQGFLNSPRSLVVAPKHFGSFSSQLLVGNLGNGLINAYDFDGKHLGTLKDEHGRDLYIDGLSGMAKHNNVVYFTSQPDNRTNGLIGKIEFKDE